MATKINDLPTATRLLQTYGPISATDENIESDAIDLIDGDGPAFALISIGEVSVDATLSATLQTSPDASEWEDVDDGALPVADVESNTIRALAFQRKHRYVRMLVSVTNNGLPTPLAVLIGQGRKQI